jgi:hypothetical protein
MKTKYNRTSHFDFSPGATKDDRISSDCSNLIGKRVVITEKLDGENCGQTNKGVYARSHAEFTKSPWAKEVRQINDRIKHDLEDGLFLFGENMEGIHSIEYTDLKSYFYLFGIRKDGIWLSWKDVEEYAFLLDLLTVPVLFDGVFNSYNELKNFVEKATKEPSRIGGLIEGVVARSYDSFNDSEFDNNIRKWVRENHVQTDEHWTKNWVKAKLKW